MTESAKWDGAAYLKTRHTRVLMKMRESVYRVNGGRYFEYSENNDAEVFYDPFNDGRVCVSLAQIKAELATREHVPNKKEAKRIRQQRARHLH